MTILVRILKKTAYVLPLVVAISLVAFGLLHIAPGGPVGLLSGNPKMTGDDLARIRENYGLDRPLPVQYLCWFREVFIRFDFGKSYVTGRSVTDMILERIPATLELMAVSLILAILAGSVIGVLSAARKDGMTDQVFSIVSIAGISMPVFWLGLIAIYVFSVKLEIFPAGGRETLATGSSLVDRIQHLALPSLVLSLSYLAVWVRYLRSSLLEVAGSDFIRTARAKGLGERTVIMKHAMKNAVLPAMTVMLMQMPSLFTGAVITETVFSWPGMGRLFYDGLVRQDYTRVLGIIVISSFLIIIFNLAGDMLSMLLDPRMAPQGAADSRNGGGREY